jgi:trimethylamine--corrinoid protein Co-methyltransferase
MRMAAMLTGTAGAGGRYPLDLAFSPVSPLVLGRDVGEALIDTARSGTVACEILPCPAAATTAPATISAAVAQQHAEVLAGVVLAQAAAPGTPVYYGPRLSAVDPRSGAVLSGTPETGVASVAATLLARRCGLACDCYGPTSDSKVLDAQSGHERGINAVVGLLARPRFLSGIGDVAAGASTNLETLVIDDDVLCSAFYAVTCRPWDAEALNVQAMIDGALSGQGFLGSRHTRRYMRQEFVTPAVSYRGGLREWLASGRSGVVDLATERVRELVAQPPVGLPGGVADGLCELIDVAARDFGLTEWPDPRSILEM